MSDTLAKGIAYLTGSVAGGYLCFFAFATAFVGGTQYLPSVLVRCAIVSLAGAAVAGVFPRHWWRFAMSYAVFPTLLLLGTIQVAFKGQHRDDWYWAAVSVVILAAGIAPAYLTASIRTRIRKRTTEL